MTQQTALAQSIGSMPTSETHQIQAMQATDVMMNDQSMSRLMKMAEVMATSKVTVPKHLQGSTGDCFAVVMQAAQWGMNPFSVAQKTHLVNGVLGYEAQLVNAVITTRAPITGRLQFEFFGDWSKVNGKEDKSAERGVKVWATFKGEDEPRVLEIGMHQVGSVRNSPMWLSDPRQQLAYLAIKRWSRLYCPDVILGVYTPDELVERTAEVDVTPAPQPTKPNTGAASLKERMAEKAKAKSQVIDGTAVEAEPVTVELTITPVSEWLLLIQNAKNPDEIDQIREDLRRHPFPRGYLSKKDKDDIAQALTDRMDHFVVVTVPEAKAPQAESVVQKMARFVSANIVKIQECNDSDELSLMFEDVKADFEHLTVDQINQLESTYESRLNELNA